MSFNIQTNITLEFENYLESNSLDVEFIADNKIEILKKDEDENETEDSCISEEREIFDYD